MPIDESPYTDPGSQLVFTTDSALIQTGKSSRVEKAFENVDIKPYSTLRYFPEGKRNCYGLNVKKDTTYLIGATFLYGNYDGHNTNPIFDLYLGPNKWQTIDLEGLTNGSRVEIIHSPRANSLEVCLVKIGKTFPMISTIEIRPLRNDIYAPGLGSLATSFRVFFNSSYDNIR